MVSVYRSLRWFLYIRVYDDFCISEFMMVSVYQGVYDDLCISEFTMISVYQGVHDGRNRALLRSDPQGSS